MMYFKLHNITLAFGDHFLLPNSYFLRQKHFILHYFLLAFGDHFIIRNSHIKHQNVMKKETWKLILQLILSIITAIATTLGVTSCRF